MNLERLYLSDTALRGEGLAHLLGLERLEHRWLVGTPVSDEAFLRLTALPSLKRVHPTRWDYDVTGRAWCDEAHPALTPEAVAAFKRARPECRFSYAAPEMVRGLPKP